MVNIGNILLFVVPLCVSALALLALHWMPWHGGSKALARTTAYALGTSVTVGVPSATMLVAAVLYPLRGEMFWVALLVVNALVSGATVYLAYWIDSTQAITLDEVGK